MEAGRAERHGDERDAEEGGGEQRGLGDGVVVERPEPERDAAGGEDGPAGDDGQRQDAVGDVRHRTSGQRGADGAPMSVALTHISPPSSVFAGLPSGPVASGPSTSAAKPHQPARGRP